jgi:hypothetical protein
MNTEIDCDREQPRWPEPRGGEPLALAEVLAELLRRYRLPLPQAGAARPPVVRHG